VEPGRHAGSRAPERYAIPEARLTQYGFKDMHQFRNWRWYKGLGGGPIVDLGSHQIDIYTWFLGVNPSHVMASGGSSTTTEDATSGTTRRWSSTTTTRRPGR